MEHQNNQDRNNQENDSGIMDKIGQSIQNVVDTVTGENDRNDQQKRERGQHNKS